MRMPQLAKKQIFPKVYKLSANIVGKGYGRMSFRTCKTIFVTIFFFSKLSDGLKAQCVHLNICFCYQTDDRKNVSLLMHSLTVLYDVLLFTLSYPMCKKLVFWPAHLVDIWALKLYLIEVNATQQKKEHIILKIGRHINSTRYKNISFLYAGNTAHRVFLAIGSSIFLLLASRAQLNLFTSKRWQMNICQRGYDLK